MRLQISLEDIPYGSLVADPGSPSGPKFYDWSNARGVRMVTGAHGFETLSGVTAMNEREADLFLRNVRLPMIGVWAGPAAVWRGRLEDIGLVAGGIQWTAYGAMGFIDDLLYTACWSTGDISGFRPVTIDDVSTYVPEKFRMDKNNRLYIAPVSGEAYASADDIGGLVFWMPHQGRRDVYRLTFDYDVDLNTNWRAAITAYDEGFTNASDEWTVTTSGSGSATVTFSSQTNGFVFRAYNNTGVPVEYSGETGAKYAKITNLRIFGVASTTVYANTVAGDVMSAAAGLNANRIKNNGILISSPGADLIEAVYLDRRGGDVLRELAATGDNGNAQFEVGFYSDFMHFRTRGSDSNTWYVDATRLEYERSLAVISNSAYAIYNDPAGSRMLRTADNSDAASIDRYNVTREDAVRSPTTSSTEAGRQRDALLEERADPPPRATLEFDRVLDSRGGLVEKWRVRAGDTISVRNGPDVAGPIASTWLNFRAARVEYFLDEDRLAIEPEAMSPSLSFLIASRQPRDRNVNRISNIRRQASL